MQQKKSRVHEFVSALQGVTEFKSLPKCKKTDRYLKLAEIKEIYWNRLIFSYKLRQDKLKHNFRLT